VWDSDADRRAKLLIFAPIVLRHQSLGILRHCKTETTTTLNNDAYELNGVVFAVQQPKILVCCSGLILIPATDGVQ
jgi:hypothetical protein